MAIKDLNVDCWNFSRKYPNDIAKDELISEIEHVKQIHRSNLVEDEDILKPLELLNKLHSLKLSALFPNICIALRIFLTLPVTVASGERSFSKLKIIKNRMRNSTGQERLISLSVLSIEHDLSRQVSFDSVIDAFASDRARKVPLK